MARTRQRCQPEFWNTRRIQACSPACASENDELDPARPPSLQQPLHLRTLTVFSFVRGGEAQRLSRGLNRVELARTQEVVGTRLRSLGPPPRVVLDVGGGAGVYAYWLAQRGYEVHLLDPVPLHVDQAKAASVQHPSAP